jgi:2-polyprenyl-3-methyl-5-hydroxy-6-metoxy-1,4-benzoquinol methylase
MATPRAAYDTWHGYHEVDRDANSPWHELLFAHLDTARDLDGRRVLEIACGRGGLACRLASGPHRPRHLLAADFSTTAVAKGRLHAQQRGLHLQWSVSDLHACPLCDGAFDTVISCESIEHLEHPQVACREFARVLKPGGRVYVTTPNYLGPLGLYRAYARLRGRPYTEGGQPINRFMLLPRTCHWLRRAGFRVVNVDAIGHYVPWPGRPWQRLSALDGLPVLRWLALHSIVVGEKR